MARRTKNIVYLWGAGATHAEVQDLGLSLLMRDTPSFGEGITRRILTRVDDKAIGAFDVGQEVDIEKLISLFAASGTEKHLKLADRLRRGYFAELVESLDRLHLLSGPPLATRLMRLHAHPKFRENETLVCFLTTNHDGLLQIASQDVHGGVSIGVDFRSGAFQPSKAAPPILQLHGSFTWHFGVPMSVEPLANDSKFADTVWIPPTILKESKTFPFNKLAAKAYEFLSRECDVLRVIGTSLTQNDWHILSLIFNAQRHRDATRRRVFQVELIMPMHAGEVVKRECAYLRNVRSIGHITDGDFAEYLKWSNKAPDGTTGLANPLAYWLEQKTAFHRIDLDGVAPIPVQPIAGAA
jgi:hypothetical protein